MKYIAFTISFLLTQLAYGSELNIKYERDPEIFISDSGLMSLVIYPDGNAAWLSQVPIKSFIKDNNYDWKAFHKEAENHSLEIKYSKEIYLKIFSLCKKIISKAKPTNKGVGGKGYTSYSISFWKNPSISYRFGSIGGTNYPEEINALKNYIKNLPLKIKK